MKTDLPLPEHPAAALLHSQPRPPRAGRLATLLLLVALPAFAAAPLSFEEVDTDGDGLVSADEAANVAGLDFDAADTDQDGTLTVDEYEIAVGKWVVPSAVAPPMDDEDHAHATPPPNAPSPSVAPAPKVEPPSATPQDAAKAPTTAPAVKNTATPSSNPAPASPATK